MTSAGWPMDDKLEFGYSQQMFPKRLCDSSLFRRISEKTFNWFVSTFYTHLLVRLIIERNPQTFHSHKNVKNHFEKHFSNCVIKITWTRSMRKIIISTNILKLNIEYMYLSMIHGSTEINNMYIENRTTICKGWAHSMLVCSIDGTWLCLIFFHDSN